MDLLCFETISVTPDNLEGIAPFADLFLFTGSNGRASPTKDLFLTINVNPVAESPSPGVEQRKKILPGGRNTLICLKDLG